MNSLVGVEAVHYLPDGSFQPVKPEVTELEDRAMGMCLELADMALAKGNPPVGAVLIDRGSGRLWGAETLDRSSRYLTGHAEMRAYDQAHPAVGDNLEDCVMVTTSQPCTSCTPPLAEGKIGKIIYAVSRAEIYPITGIMRPREINMHELLADGATDTVVVGGYRKEEAIGKFTLWGELHGSPDTIGR